MFVAATSSPVRRRALNTDVFQMTGSCSTEVAWASHLDLAASKGTLWAVGSCFHVTFARTAQVSVVSCRMKCTLWCRVQPAHVLLFSRVSLSDETEDWDFDMSPKPNEVQNDMYVRDEEEGDGEEGEAEDLDGRKVVVRWRGFSDSILILVQTASLVLYQTKIFDKHI